MNLNCPYMSEEKKVNYPNDQTLLSQWGLLVLLPAFQSKANL